MFVDDVNAKLAILNVTFSMGTLLRLADCMLNGILKLIVFVKARSYD